MIKKILLTGATGFIGSHLLEELLMKNYQVVITKRSSSDTWRINDFMSVVKSYNTDGADLEVIFRENKVDCIVHLATNYIKKHENSHEAEAMIEDNVKFPSVLAELGVKSGVKHFINTGTFFEYEMKDSPIYESDLVSPYNFYAATKVAFSEILKYYSSKFGLTVFDLKLFAPFGEKDNEKLMVFLIKNLLKGDSIDFSGGEQKWNFTYVKDIINAYMMAIKAVESSTGYQSFNIGNGEARSIREMAGILEEISGKKFNIRWGSKPYAENEIFYVNCDSSKAKIMLGWEPEFSARSGLEIMYNYYLHK